MQRVSDQPADLQLPTSSAAEMLTEGEQAAIRANDEIAVIMQVGFIYRLLPHTVTLETLAAGFGQLR